MSLERVVYIVTLMTFSGMGCQMRALRPTVRISIRV